MKKILKLTFILFLFYFLIFTNLSLANEIIHINSVEDYLKFATNNEYFDGYENKTILLNTDLDFQNQNVPIVSGKFKGVFDGQGHSFKNIKLEPGEDFRFDLGLFEENWGLIKKVVVESGTITGEHTTGAICGTNCGVVEQCANFVNISSEHAIGGIVGWNEGQGIVRNCYNVGNITDLSPGSGGTIGFGGIVGFLYSGTILDCYNVGTIAPEREHSKGNIVGTYYSENSDREFIDRCFSLMTNSNNASNNENLYCLQLLEFNEDFYSNLSLETSFIKTDNQYPHINMHIDLDALPPLVTLPSNFDKNPFFENYYENVTLKSSYEPSIKDPSVYEYDNDNNNTYQENTFESNDNILDTDKTIEYNSESQNNDLEIDDVLYLMNKDDYEKKHAEKETNFADSILNLEEKIYDFFDVLASLSFGNLALITIIFTSTISIIIYKSHNNNRSDDLNDNSDDSNYL